MVEHQQSLQRTVVVGIGGSGVPKALAWATDEAARTGAGLLLLTVDPFARCSGQIRAAVPGHPSAGRVGTQVLDVVAGSTGPALAGVARDADLLVIGCGRGGGTVHDVLRHSRVPVIVARGTPGGAGATFADHVVVGVDGTAAGRAALDFAFAYADRHDLPVAAVHVSATHGHGLDAEVVDRLRAEVDPWASEHPRVRVRRSVVRDEVAAGLVRAGLGAHLLVVGSRRRGAVPRAVTVDLPARVARTADCPVAVVPAGRRR